MAIALELPLYLLTPFAKGVRFGKMGQYGSEGFGPTES